jgi:hypothetical protein
MQKIDDCKEIRLALTRAGIATRPEKCLQTFRLVVTAQYIYRSRIIEIAHLTHLIRTAMLTHYLVRKAKNTVAENLAEITKKLGEIAAGGGG